MFWDRTRPGIRIIYRSYNIHNVQYRRIKATKCSRKRRTTAYFTHETARKRCQYNSALFGGNGIKRRRFPFRWNTLRNLEWRIMALKPVKNGHRFHRLRPELSRFEAVLGRIRRRSDGRNDRPGIFTYIFSLSFTWLWQPQGMYATLLLR